MLEVVLLKFKKCGFLLSLVMLICFAIPSFASAQERNIFSGKGVYTSLDFDTPYKNYTGKHVVLSNSNYTELTFDINPQRSKALYVDLGSDMNVKNISLEANGGSHTTKFRPNFYSYYYDKNKNLILSDEFEVSTGGRFSRSLEASNIRYVGFKLVSKFDVEAYAAFNSLTLMGDDSPRLEEIKNLNAIVGVDNVNFTWDLPKESQKSIDAIKISTGDKSFKMGSLVKDYKFTGLTPDTEYSFLIQTEKNGELSEGVVKKVRTLPKPKEPMPLVKPPENVILTPQNGKMVIAWDDVKSPDLEGYNVYIDGKKVNDEPLKSNKLIVKSLENGKSYKVQISAVNKENAEGEKSKVKEEKPSVDALEVEYDVKMPFSAFDLLTSSVSLLGILGGFILLGLAIIWFRPLKRLIVNAVRKEKDKK